MGRRLRSAAVIAMAATWAAVSHAAEQPPATHPQKRRSLPANDERPEELAYSDGDPIPAGYHVETRARHGLVISGLILVGVPWLVGLPAATSTESTSSAPRWLFVPAIGPWGLLASYPSCAQEPDYDRSLGPSCRDGDELARTLLVVDGILQGIGSILITVGLVARERALVRTDQVLAQMVPRALRIVPSRLAPNAFGLTASGEF